LDHGGNGEEKKEGKTRGERKKRGMAKVTYGKRGVTKGLREYLQGTLRNQKKSKEKELQENSVDVAEKEGDCVKKDERVRVPFDLAEKGILESKIVSIEGEKDEPKRGMVDTWRRKRVIDHESRDQNVLDREATR